VTCAAECWSVAIYGNEARWMCVFRIQLIEQGGFFPMVLQRVQGKCRSWQHSQTVISLNLSDVALGYEQRHSLKEHDGL
jgi:hypothetical protein